VFGSDNYKQLFSLTSSETILLEFKNQCSRYLSLNYSGQSSTEKDSLLAWPDGFCRPQIYVVPDAPRWQTLLLYLSAKRNQMYNAGASSWVALFGERITTPIRKLGAFLPFFLTYLSLSHSF
jgi:hypothetical protein